MNAATPQNFLSEAHRKYKLGLERLERIGNDTVVLGTALLSIHGALEDHTRARIALSARIPRRQRELVLQPGKTNWMQLLGLLEEYYALDSGDRAMILGANRLRITVAHGGEYEGTVEEVRNYGSFVERILKGGVVGSTWRGAQRRT